MRASISPQILVLLPLMAGVVLACSPDWAATGAATARSTTATPSETPGPSNAVATVTAPTSPGCYFKWATQELSDLGKELRAQLMPFDGQVRASAYAFGEDCIRDDGTRTFLPMETDFRVSIPVESLTDEAQMGTWISRVFTVVDALPASAVIGPRPGRVEFEFRLNESESLRLTIERSRYGLEARSLDPTGLFRYFRQQQ